MNYTATEEITLLNLLDHVVPDYEKDKLEVEDLVDRYNVTLNKFDGRVFFSCDTTSEKEFAVCFIGAKYPQFFKYSENTEELLGF